VNRNTQKRIYREVAELQLKHDSDAVDEQGNKLSFKDIETVRLKHNLTVDEIFKIIGEGSKPENIKWRIPEYG